MASSSSSSSSSCSSSSRSSPSPSSPRSFDIDVEAKKEGAKKIVKDGWTFATRNSHILPSNLSEKWIEELDVPRIPTMVFGNNFLAIENQKTKLKYQFNAHDALKEWRKAPWFNTAVSVAYADAWREMRDHPDDLSSTVPFDWTFTTPYLGVVSLPGKDHLETQLTPTTDTIDLELLKRPDPILFFDSVPLFEDELDDNGVASLSCKIRVMPTCFFVLMRFWLRVDDVLFRIRDTRVFHKFGTTSVLVETTIREESYGSLRQRKAFPNDPRKLNDQNHFSQLLPLKESHTFKIDL